MAAKRTNKAGDVARQIRENPIIGRLLDDAELRDSIRSAYESSHKAYSRLSSSKGPAALLDDKKLQKDLRAPRTRCARPARRSASRRSAVVAASAS